MPDASTIAGWLERARAIVRASDQMVLEKSAGRLSIDRKADRSFVTNIDLAVEEEIRERLMEAFPDHGILGEELEPIESSSGFRWVIDPIDGTHSLRHRIPLFGTLLALLEDDRPLLGIVSLPLLGRSYFASRGAGAYRDGLRLELADVNSEEDILDEIIAAGERRQFLRAGSAEVFDRLMTVHPGVRTYCDCFGHALAFDGSVAAMVDYDVRIWDIAASRVIIEEAGGTFRILNQRTVDRETRFDVVLGKPSVVAWIEQRVLPAAGHSG